MISSGRQFKVRVCRDQNLCSDSRPQFNTEYGHFATNEYVLSNWFPFSGFLNFEVISVSVF